MTSRVPKKKGPVITNSKNMADTTATTTIAPAWAKQRSTLSACLIVRATTSPPPACHAMLNHTKGVNPSNQLPFPLARTPASATMDPKRASCMLRSQRLGLCSPLTMLSKYTLANAEQKAATARATEPISGFCPARPVDLCAWSVLCTTTTPSMSRSREIHWLGLSMRRRMVRVQNAVNRILVW